MFVYIISVDYNSIIWNIQDKYNYLYPTKEENEVQVG